MKYNFNEEINRRGTNCEKFDHCKTTFGQQDIIPLWIADTDLKTPDFVIEALHKRLEHPIFGYTFRSESYYRSVQQWVKRRNNWDIDMQYIGFSPGIVCGLALSIQAFSGENDGVVIQPPVYPPFATTILANGRTLINNPLIRNGAGDYRIDFDDLDRKLNGAKIFVLCNPHNPTGRMFTKDELLRMGELCIKHNVIIVSDEIHSDLTLNNRRHIHIASLSPELAKRTITFIAPSKSFNMAGLSTSVVIIPDPERRKCYMEHFDRIHIDQGNIFGTVALEAAYTHGDEWLDQLMEHVGGNMDFVIGFLAEHLPSVKAYKPESTFLMWLDFGQWGMAQCDLEKFLICKAGLVMNNGKDFGEEGEGFMRLNVGTTRCVLEKAMRQLKFAYDNRDKDI